MDIVLSANFVVVHISRFMIRKENILQKGKTMKDKYYLDIKPEGNRYMGQIHKGTNKICQFVKNSVSSLIMEARVYQRETGHDVFLGALDVAIETSVKKFLEMEKANRKTGPYFVPFPLVDIHFYGPRHIGEFFAPVFNKNVPVLHESFEQMARSQIERGGERKPMTTWLEKLLKKVKLK